MQLTDIIAILISLSALFSWFNVRFLKMPTAIGLMLIALLLSLFLLLPLPFSDGLEADVRAMLNDIDFDATVLHGMLSFLLFAGALHVKLSDLASQKWVIGLLASFGVLCSTVLVGVGSYVIFLLLGLDVPLIYCLLFGALISPTDPIAVLGILKSAGAPKSLETKITGESLFNDGVAVVTFMLLVGIATGGEQVTVIDMFELFGYEAIGGLLFGLATGGLAYLMLRHIDHYQVEVLVTLALATGGYAMAQHFHFSAPITVVVAGLLIGNQGRKGAMSDTTRQRLDTFWELVDEVLNAVLFVLIGLEVLVLTFNAKYLTAGLLAILLVLIARAISIGIPITLLRRSRNFSPAVITILTWGGLRGGISVALALSLPDNGVRDLLVTVTYMVVVFSILVQGLTLAPVVRANAQRAAIEMDQRPDLPARKPEFPPDHPSGSLSDSQSEVQHDIELQPKPGRGRGPAISR